MLLLVQVDVLQIHCLYTFSTRDIQISWSYCMCMQTYCDIGGLGILVAVLSSKCLFSYVSALLFSLCGCWGVLKGIVFFFYELLLTIFMWENEIITLESIRQKHLTSDCNATSEQMVPNWWEKCASWIVMEMDRECGDLSDYCKPFSLFCWLIRSCFAIWDLSCSWTNVLVIFVESYSLK